MSLIRERVTPAHPPVRLQSRSALVSGTASSRRRLGALLLALAGGCSTDDPGGPVPVVKPPLPTFGLVSDPGLPASSLAAAAVIAGGHVAYVSLPPHSLDDGVRATVVNLRTTDSLDIPLSEGGFDPVVIGAEMGDSIALSVNRLGGLSDFRRIQVVPAARRPVIVRTSPPPKKRDVPLAERIVIVFSEPVDATSATSETVRIRTGNGTAIAATVSVLDETPWIVTVTPQAPLATSTTYEVLVFGSVRDWDGDEMGGDVVSSFTTMSAVAALGGRLAFAAANGNGWFIHTMRPDGTDLRTLHRGVDPAYSPDGTKIAFLDQDGIYIMDADGGGNVRFVAEGYNPDWSPDGTRLVFGCGGICVINLDGTGLVEITHYDAPQVTGQVTGATCIQDSDPTWSADGRSIAFVRWPEQGAQYPCMTLGLAAAFPFDFWTGVHVATVDNLDQGVATVSVGPPLVSGYWPTFSPDGLRLAAFSVEVTGMQSVAVMNADGTNKRTIASRPWGTWMGSPAWSPDGSRIAFGSADEWALVDPDNPATTDVVTSPFSFPTMVYYLWSWSRR